jgi:hypothetical protein
METEGMRATSDDTNLAHPNSPKLEITAYKSSVKPRNHPNRTSLFQTTEHTDFPIDEECSTKVSSPFDREPLSNKIGALMSSRAMETAVLVLIILYTSIVFTVVAFEEELSDYKIYISVVELFILTLFAVEIGLKVYAWKIEFLRDGWNIFDI